MRTDGQIRIALVHALAESVAPIHAAFSRLWPEAYRFDVLDTALAEDLAAGERLDDGIADRIAALADYAAHARGVGGGTDGILFTCSAFGPAIDAVKPRLPIPVLRPNEAAFEAALDRGTRIGLMVTFGPSLSALRAELAAMAGARGKKIDIVPVLVDGALAALKAGDGQRHDRLAAEAAASLPPVDVVVLGQFSLARARDAVRGVTAAEVLTTPESAVLALKARTGNI